MKTILKRFISSLFIVIMSVSCSNDNKKFDILDPDGKPITKGSVSFANINVTVDLSVKGESVTKADAIDVQQFHVTLINKKDNSVVGTWLKADMPEMLEVLTGDYTVKCENILTHKSADWEQPYYAGSQDFKVTESTTTNVENVVCKLANLSIKVNFSEMMKKEMKEFRVNVTNSKGILTYISTETRKGYFNPGTIVASLQGTRLDGTSVAKVITIPDAAAGDAQVISFDVNTKGNATIGIVVDVTVNEKVVNVEIVDDGTIVDPDPKPDPDPEDPEKPEVKLPSITGVGFDISQTMTLASGATKVVDVKVFAPNGGIKTLDVLIESPTLGPLLDGLGIPSNLDLVTPTPEVKKLLQELKLIGTEPVKGKTEFQFSIGSFTPLLPIGTHKFKVSLVDDSGAKVIETLTIVVS